MPIKEHSAWNVNSGVSNQNIFFYFFIFHIRRQSSIYSSGIPFQSSQLPCIFVCTVSNLRMASENVNFKLYHQKSKIVDVFIENRVISEQILYYYKIMFNRLVICSCFHGHSWGWTRQETILASLIQHTKWLLLCIQKIINIFICKIFINQNNIMDLLDFAFLSKGFGVSFCKQIHCVCFFCTQNHGTLLPSLKKNKKNEIKIWKYL